MRPVTFYDAVYDTFGTELAAAIRAAAYDRDIGQNSWLTAAEQRLFWGWLDVSANSHVLDVGSGSGGPAIYMAAETGCTVTGVELHPAGVAAGNQEARDRGLEQRARFLRGDVREALPIPSASVDAVICVDAINHVYNRRSVFGEWFRVLRPGGAVLFTDPLIVTGLIRSDEIATRAGSLGEQVFTAPGVNERLLRAAGFEQLRVEDRTDTVTAVATSRRRARSGHRAELEQLEGTAVTSAYEQYLSVAEVLARERRLTRLAYIARCPPRPG